MTLHPVTGLGSNKRTSDRGRTFGTQHEDARGVIYIYMYES